MIPDKIEREMRMRIEEEVAERARILQRDSRRGGKSLVIVVWLMYIMHSPKPKNGLISVTRPTLFTLPTLYIFINFSHTKKNVEKKEEKTQDLSLSFSVAHVSAGGYHHHWCLRLYFQSFSNIQPEISSQKQLIE